MQCRWWYDCTLDLQEDDTVDLVDYPELECILEDDHDGPHQVELVKSKYRLEGNTERMVAP